MNKKDQSLFDIEKTPAPIVCPLTVFPLTTPQQGIWFAHHLTPEATGKVFKVAGYAYLNGHIQPALMETAIRQAISEAETLRIHAWYDTGHLYQRVEAFPDWQLSLIDLTDCPEPDDAARQWMASRVDNAIPLETQQPLFDIALLRSGVTGYYLYCSTHHIAADGYGFMLFSSRIAEIYSALVSGIPVPPADILGVAVQTEAEQSYLASATCQRDKEFWLEEMSRNTHPVSLASAPVSPCTDVLYEQLLIGPETYCKLQGIAKKHDSKMSMLVVALTVVYLCLMTGETSIRTGFIHSGRMSRKLRQTTGLLANILPLGIEIDPKMPLSELLEQVQSQVNATSRRSRFPAEKLRQLMGQQGKENSWFSTVINFIPSHYELNFGDVSSSLIYNAIGPADDFSFNICDWGEELGLNLIFNANSSLYEQADLQRHTQRFHHFLTLVAESGSDYPCQLDLLSAGEREQVMTAFQGPQMDYPEHLCIHQLFEQQAECHPDAVAVVCDETSLTYGELNRRANQLAHGLAEKGVVPGSRVAIALERSCDMVAAMLAILKAGGAYVPLDPVFPAQRLQYMVEDSQPAALISDGSVALAETLGAQLSTLEIIDIHRDKFWFPTLADTNPQISHAETGAMDDEQLAYLIYTSGSTGKPKGVMVPHRSVTNFLLSQKQQHHVTEHSRLLAVTTISFDIHVLEIYLPLISGGELHLAGKLLSRDGDALGRYLSEKQISLFQATPATWKLLLASSWQGAPELTGLIGGESFPKALADSILSRIGCLWNMYGPTETTVWSASWQIKASDPCVLIGQPVANTRIYILDSNQQPVPVGACGEIYIAGDGVTHGYRNRPDLTTAVFLPDPFAVNPDFSAENDCSAEEKSGKTDTWMYRTGDLGRWHSNGAIECLGRSDFQVKIRGYRIEPGEIEAIILADDGIEDVVVSAVEIRNGEPALIAWYIASGEIQESELKTQLRACLPDYMVPVGFVAMDAFPLTPNGKVDRRALPAPDMSALAKGDYEAPHAGTETQLAAIWQQLFGLEKVSRNAHFFELGGHSLLAMQLIARVRDEFRTELPLADIFSRPLLSDIAHAVTRAPVLSDEPGIMPYTGDTPPPLSMAQQRLWLLFRFHPGASAAYNMTGSVVLEGPLDIGVLRQALNHIVQRHHVLRSHIEVVDGRPVQITGPENQGMRLSVIDAQEAADTAFSPVFNLSAGPLIEGQLIRLDEQKYRLRIAMHHIISDGWSVGLLIQETGRLYAALAAGQSDPLPLLHIQYSDYAAWQHDALQGDKLHGNKLQVQQDYWTQQLQGIPDCLTLPADRERPKAQQFFGDNLTIALDDTFTAALRTLSHQNQCTLFMTLLSGWAALMGRLASQDDVVIGTPVAGRTHTELEALIGMFVNTQAIRVGLSDSLTTSGLLSQVKETVLLAQSHQDLPFEQVVEAVAPTRSFSHSPVFQVMFGMQGGADIELNMPGLQCSGVETEITTAQFDLNLQVIDAGDTLTATLNYSTALFDKATAQRYLGYWQQLLREMTAAPELPLSQLPVLDGEEYQQVTEGFNQTETPFPDTLCVHQLFEHTVTVQPQATAVVCEQQSLTYDELNQQANQLARWLVAQGVQPDSCVAVSLERSCDLVVALMAILKAGGAYVPLDPGYPQDRLAYMLADSQPVAVLTTGVLQPRLGEIPAQTVVVDMAAEKPWADLATDNLNLPGLTNRHLAYIIYTSGSTGNPKGVMNEHRGVVNRLSWMKDDYGFAPDDVVLQKTPFSFDVSVWEFFCTLWAGSTLLMAKPEGHKDPLYLKALIEQQRVTILHFVPPMLQTFLEVISGDDCSGLRLIFCSGEALSAAAVRKAAQRLPHAELHNLYGPTEAAVDVTAWPCPKDLQGDRMSIGAPVANTRMYVLDTQGQPVPVGVAGELYIGGVQVARGYFNREDLTAEKFLPDPFSTQPDAQMYRTGDVGRWLPDGTIEYQGRNDDQIKIRGFRVELGEIASALQDCEGVHEAVVIASGQGADKRLVGYYTQARQAQPVTAEALRISLSASLPDHMIPIAWVMLDTLPLTPNGKVNRRALPEPDDSALIQQDYEAPQGEAEQCLAGIWQSLLNVPQVGRHDNFFELGGHSLMAVILIERLRQQGWSLAVRELFEQPGLARLASVLKPVTACDTVEVPENLIPADCREITPEMLPLIDLNQAEIEIIGASVLGGAANIQDIYPLAPLQEGILFHHLMQSEGDPYITRFIQAFDNEAEVDSFVAALQHVVRRHDILRTAVVWDGLETPVQVVWREAPVLLESLDFTASEDVLNALQQHFEPAHTRMDVQNAPMIEAYKVADPAQNRWLLCFLMHHLCNDHTTMELLAEEVMMHLSDRTAELPAPLPFRNFVAQATSAAGREGYLTYFRELLADLDEPCVPFGIAERETDQPVQIIHQEIDAVLAGQLRGLARQHKMSAAAVFHLAWAMVVGSATGRDDVVFGTVLFGRMAGGEGADRALGMFLNTLPLRLSLETLSVSDALHQTQRQLTELLEHEYASLSQAQQCSGVNPQTPLFSAMINYRYQGGSQQTADESISEALRNSVVFAQENTNYPLTLTVNDIVGDGFSIEIQADSRIGASRVTEMFSQALTRLTDALIRSEETPVCQLEVLSRSERHQVLEGFNQTETPFPDTLCVHQLFEQTVAAQPQATAVVCDRQSLTYAELNRQSNQLARWLVKQGVRPDSRVAVSLERSCDLVVAMMATLKAGGAYVPLDPGYPQDRLTYMLADSQPVVVFTTAGLQARLGEIPQQTTVVDMSALRPWADEDTDDLNLPELTNRHLAYVIYTSGSTGKPKGVMNEHRGVVNRLSWMKDDYGFSPDDVVLQKTPFSFDVSVWEFFGTLWAGATLVMAKPEGHKDPHYLKTLIEQQQVSILHFVPPMLQTFLEVIEAGDCASLRLIFCSGEALPAAAVRKTAQRLPKPELHNLYGPTEAAVDVTAWSCPKDLQGDRMSIGAPVGNTRMYVLDAQGQPVPVGVPGELYIGGVQVARGYLNRPELTAEKFIPDPFVAAQDAQMYRTGDVGCWLADGTIDYQGRNDDQVKIRGFRVELGEISSALQDCRGVQEAVVIARGSGADKQLVGYFTAQDDSTTLESVKAELSSRLPEHMVPAAYMVLDTLPLTPNGKVNRKVLPEPDATAVIRQAYEAPAGETEQLLADIWQQLLGVSQVSRHDNFFELGGHSLMAVQLISRIRSALGCEIPLTTLFAQPVLAQLADELAGQQQNTTSQAAIVPVADGETPPLSLAQQRLWFLSQMEPSATAAYTVYGSVRLSGPLDTDALQQALDRIVSRHAPLRTRFIDMDGVPGQIVGDVNQGFRLTRLEMASAGLLCEEIACENIVCEDIACESITGEDIVPFRPEFDLTTGPLAQGQLIRLHEHEHWLRLAMHHIITDGWSMEIFTRELSALYDAFSQGLADPLPPLPVQYGDFATWQQSHLLEGRLQKQQQYWVEQLKDAPACLTLPTDRPRPASQDYSGASFDVSLDETLTARLKAFSQRQGCTLYMTLLAGWATLMSRLSGQEEVVIGSPVAGRTRAELEDLIGMFVNTQAIRVDLSQQPDAAGLMQQVKATALAAQSNQELPFEQVVEAVSPIRSLSYSPVFQVMFSLQNMPQESRELNGLTLSALPETLTTAQFDLSLILHESDNRIEGFLNYATALFDEATVQRYFGYWVTLLEGIIAEHDSPVTDGLPVTQLPLLEKSAQQQLIESFNQTQRDYPSHLCVHQRFEQMAAARPQATALIDGERQYDYQTLNQMANRLASRLKQQGVGAGDYVAVCLKRSAELIVAELGILKCGAAYVPLDTSVPAERMQYMVKDCRTKLMLVHEGSEHLTPLLTGVAIMPVSCAMLQQAVDADDSLAGIAAADISSGSAAYVMYTSGSTGQPKGVVVPHRGITRLVLSCGYADFRESDRVALAANPAFDATTMEIWAPLLNGGAVVVISQETLLDPTLFAEALRQYEVSVMWLTVGLFNQYAESLGDTLKQLRYLMVGGDVLDPAVIRRVLNNYAPQHLLNGYGPTESTTFALTYEIETLAEDATSVPVGRPIGNTRVYILDQYGQPAPVGVSGELFIAGDGLALGYLNQPEMTMERFIPDPFSDDPHARMYQTGDLGRWREDGVIEFEGRNDFQVKIRGFRIELDEIEAAVRGAGWVEQVVVLAPETQSGSRLLAAYYVGGADAETLRRHVSGVLPEWMIPSAWIQLEEFPLNPNGKVNRKALPEPGEEAVIRQAYEAPEGELEIAIAEIWQELLGVEKPGRFDSFFELGGHSLLAAQLISKIREELGLEIPMTELFSHPTLAGFSMRVAYAGLAEFDVNDLMDLTK